MVTGSFIIYCSIHNTTFPKWEMLPSPCERVGSTYWCGCVWSKALFSVDWLWLYQLSLDVGSGSTNYLWKFCDLQRLAVAVPTVSGGSVTCRSWQWLYELCVEVGSGCTNCLSKFCDLQSLAVAVPALWRFHDLHRLTVVPTVSGSPVTCRGWQWLYQLSLELLLDSQLTIHAPVLAHGTK